MSDSLYREKYVAFIDMLGFSNLVRDAAVDLSKQSIVIDAIDRLKDTACNNPDMGMIVSYFSDCVVISCDRTRHGLAEMLMSLLAIAENLLVIDIMVRGGLTVGYIHHDADFMFGPGMLEAYDIERCIAKHPTIMLSNAAHEDVVKEGFDHVIIHDSAEPERRYLHYLASFANYDPTPRNGLMSRSGPSLLIRHYIAKRLRDGEGSTLAKAEWLERYWNETVGDKGIFGCVDRIADLALPDATPFRFIRRKFAG